MGFFTSLFSEPESAGLSLNYWRDRASTLEKELREEREKREKEATRNRKREDALIDRIVVSKGQTGIAKQVENSLGFDIPKQPPELTPAEKNELKYFVDHSVSQGIPAKDAEISWRHEHNR